MACLGQSNNLDWAHALTQTEAVILAVFKPSRLRKWSGMVSFLICFPASASTDSGWFTRMWQTDEGLLNNNIHSIVQSRDQYVWLATPASLMRFDGATFSQFPVKEFTGSIEPHNVHILLYSRTGVLWIAPNVGMLAGLNPDFSRVTLPPGVPTNGPATMTEGRDGSLWVGYYSRTICRIRGGQVTSFRAKERLSAAPSSLSSDGAGNIWLASGNLLYLFRNGQFEPAVHTPGIQCLTGSHTNGIWFVTEAHLFLCGTNGVPQDYGAFQNSPAATAHALLEDHNGSVWIGTDGNGLFRSSESGFERIETSHSSILSLMEDREGNIWAGTGGGGLNRISLSQVRREVAEGSLHLGEIQSICEDTNGIMWGATRNGVLISRTNGEWSPALTNASFSGTVICVAAGRDGAIWLGTRSGEVVRLMDTNYTIWNPEAASADGSICALLPSSSGDLWIITSRIQRLHDGQLQDMHPTQGRIFAIAEDAAGNIWIGAKGTVMRFDGKDFVDESPRLPVANRTIPCLYGTRDGSMWISCGGVGLLRFKNGQVGQVGTEQGLFNNFISQIVADDEGWLWFGSDRGIFKIRQQELEQAMDNTAVQLRPIVYGRNEGLPSLEALFSSASPVQPLAIHSHDDRVWLLMHTGVVMADPKTLPENYPAPQVLLTQVAMDGKIIASYGNVAPTQTVANLEIPAARIPLSLPPGHRHLEFDFTAIHLAAPENVRFRYQLVGIDNDWIDSKTARRAEYSRLTEGDYQFRVEACIGDGVWSETPATISLSVAPFLWQTWWFRASALILFTGSVIAIVRYISFRRLQLKMRMVEQRAALDKERTRIARDLHDDLGGSLNSVALSLDMMQREPPEPESINRKIHHCSTMVRQVARSVDEIVWAINPRNDTLRYVVDYISQFAVEFMHAADIPCRVDLPDTIPDRLLSPEARHSLFLVVKEALNNVARHARASEVRLRITTVDNQVAITIEDNGRGFERAPDNASSDGLRNMRQRMEEIGGQCDMTSRPGTGTRVSFLYSWPLENGQ
jgi:signal transduction histidine kinase/ligand-binding sensor domain-containing protein